MDHVKIYNQIIGRARTRTFEGYKERHHIIPKCLGGLNDKSNIVELTAREHFLCHMLLCEIYPNELKLKQALWLMAIGKQKVKGKHYKLNSRLYDNIKKNLKVSEETKIKMSNSFKGRKWTKEQNLKRSIKIKGRILSQETKNKISNSNKGKIVNNKPILQYDLKGNFIKEWVSQKEAYRVTKIHYGSISYCCKGKIKTAGKFIWKFKNDLK